MTEDYEHLFLGNNFNMIAINLQSYNLRFINRKLFTFDSKNKMRSRESVREKSA